MHIVIILFLLIGLYELVIGLRQFVGIIFYDWSCQSICGTFNNQVVYSIFIVLIFPIAWFCFLQMKSLRRGNLLRRFIFLLSTLYVFLALCILPFTFSRTSWIAGMISCGVIAYYSIIKYSSPTIIKRYLMIFIGCIISLLCSYLFYGIKKESADGRLLIWKISTSILQEHFIKGVGNGRFSSVYGEAQEQYFKNGKGSEYEKYIAGSPSFAYNEYIQILIEQGLVGFLFFVFIIVYAFYHLIQSESQYKIAFIGALISLLIVSFFSYPFRNIYTCLLSVCVIFFSLLFPHKKYEEYFTIKRGVVFAIFFVTAIDICYSFGVLGNKKMAYKQWNALKPYFYAGQFSEITKNYAVLYPYLKTDAAFLFEYGQCLSQIKQYEKSNDILKEGLFYSGDPMFLNIIGNNYQQQGYFQLAENMFYKAYYRIPHKIYPLYLRMNLYKEQCRKEEMITLAYYIMNLKNKVNSEETIYIKELVKREIENNN